MRQCQFPEVKTFYHTLPLDGATLHGDKETYENCQKYLILSIVFGCIVPVPRVKIHFVLRQNDRDGALQRIAFIERPLRLILYYCRSGTAIAKREHYDNLIQTHRLTIFFRWV